MKHNGADLLLFDGVRPQGQLLRLIKVGRAREPEHAVNIAAAVPALYDLTQPNLAGSRAVNLINHQQQAGYAAN